MQALPKGSHVVFADDIYYDFRTIANEFFPNSGLSASMVDLSDPERLSRELRDEIALVWARRPRTSSRRIKAVLWLGRLNRG